MSTRYYGLPTVDDSATMTFVDSVNGLANSADAVLHGVAESFDKQAFDLPTASSETLGGVRIGDGFKVYSDGLLTTSAEKFELKPATETTIGGVSIGANVTNDQGRIGIGTGAFGNIEADEETLGLGVVTTPKIQANAVTAAQVSSDVLNNLKGPAALWKDAQQTLLYAKYNYWNLEWYVVRLSEKVKIVIPVGLYMGTANVPSSFDMPGTQGEYGGGKTIVTLAALSDATTKTYSVSVASNFTFEFNFDDNKVYTRAHGTGFAVYKNIRGNIFTTPGIIITD